MNKTYLITPTSGRPKQLEMCLNYMFDQPYDEHIIVTDDILTKVSGEGRQLLYRPRTEPESVNTVVQNIQFALRYVPDDSKILIIEDDDYYGPGYVALMSDLLDHSQLIGLGNYWTYSISHRKKIYRNETGHVPLACTGFQLTKPMRELINRCCDELIAIDDPFLDFKLWQTASCDKITYFCKPQKYYTALKAYGSGRPGVTSSHRGDGMFRHCDIAFELAPILGPLWPTFNRLFMEGQ